MKGKLSAFCVVLAATIAAAPVPAATFLVPADVAMVDEAPVIVEVVVMSVASSPADGPPSTDYVVMIERLLKGRVGGTSVVVRVPGGIGADGVGLRVHGAPTFREGERLLLFLSARSDGTYGVMHLSLGAFRQLAVEVDGTVRDVAVRDLAGGPTLGIETGLDSLRDWNGFRDWIGSRAASSSEPEAGYFLDREGVRALSVPLTNDWSSLAWERKAGRQRARWRWPENWIGDRAPRKRALGRWAALTGAGVRFRTTGTFDGTASLSRPNGFNDVQRADADDLIAGSFSCYSGGIVAVSVTWFDPAVTFRVGTTSKGIATRVLEADVLFNDGAQCLLGGDVGRGLAELVLAHEIGHVLGLEHAGEPTSLMFPSLSGRIQARTLDTADRERLRLFYPPRTVER